MLPRVTALMLLTFTFPLQAQDIEIGGYNIYYGSFHNHSKYSDGEGSPFEAFSTAKDSAHLDFFALTDHGELLTSKEWQTVKNTADRYNEKNVFAAFSGFEWSSIREGHMVVIGSDDYCSFLMSATSTFSEVSRWIGARNCIAFLNHPGDYDSFGNEFDHFKADISGRIVGMELWNGLSGFDVYYFNDGYYSNDGGLGYYDEALSRGWRLGASGGSDTHDLSWGSGEYMLAILAGELSRDSIINACINRRFYSTLDRNLRMSFKVNGNEMGSMVSPGRYSGLVMLEDADQEIFRRVDVIRNGSVLYSFNISEDNPLINFSIDALPGEYYYILAIQEDNDMAVSSPVFISDAVISGDRETLTGPDFTVVSLPGNHFQVGISGIYGIEKGIITDISGRPAAAFDIPVNGTAEIDLSFLSAGIYILSVPGRGSAKIAIK